MTDVIDVVKDTLHGADYVREEDPRIFSSLKTGRGPLTEGWKDEYWNECKVSPGFIITRVPIYKQILGSEYLTTISSHRKSHLTKSKV